MGSFIEFVVTALLELIILALFASAILSWLVAFEIINLRNRFVRSLLQFLDAVTLPVLRPFRRFIPPIGGVDVTPVIVIIILIGIQRFILPLIFAPLVAALG